jgi:hypothetical protein
MATSYILGLSVGIHPSAAKAVARLGARAVHLHHLLGSRVHDRPGGDGVRSERNVASGQFADIPETGPMERRAERGRCGTIVVRPTVDVEHVEVPPGLEHAVQFRQNAGGAARRVEGERRDHPVKRSVLAGCLLTVPGLELELARNTAQLGRLRHERRRRLDPTRIHSQRASPSLLGDPAVPATDEQQPVPGLDRHLIEDEQIQVASWLALGFDDSKWLGHTRPGSNTRAREPVSM